MASPAITKEKISCFHCGDPVDDTPYQADDHSFCCLGCQRVYLLLSQNNLQNYYQYNTHPGKKQAEESHLDYLDDDQIAARLLDFRDDRLSKITLYIPAIHCSSCIWLLEHLHQLEKNILDARSDFMKRQLSITFQHSRLSLKELVQLLTNIGYAPLITAQDVVKTNQSRNQNKLVQQIAVAGFCFGNAMMISFPEYFGMADFEKRYADLFGWINLSLALPSMLYSGRDYFTSAWYSLKQGHLNLDVPLALGIAILFIRSFFEIISGTGAGFSDTLCGLVFFLLIGKWVQQKTYHHLSFERDYRSYFPVAVTRIGTNGIEKATALSDVQVGDRILVRNEEIIPADAMLLRGRAAIDFSFVTGESEPVDKSLGEIIYAGGKQKGEAIELEVVKAVSQSYLTRLWNQSGAETSEKKFQTFSQQISRYFTWALLSIALSSAGYWLLQDEPGLAWGAFTAVLIIACPCALALSSPFTLSAVLSVFDRHHLYLKNTGTVEKMAAADTFVFDKTGTISSVRASALHLEGNLSKFEKSMVAAVCRNSNHPVSRELVRLLEPSGKTTEQTSIARYEEIPGQGLEALLHNGTMIRVGNATFTGQPKTPEMSAGIRINGVSKASLRLKRPWRAGLSQVIRSLSTTYDLHLLSGDSNRDRDALQLVFPREDQLHFKQSP